MDGPKEKQDEPLKSTIGLLSGYPEGAGVLSRNKRGYCIIVSFLALDS